jgi:hypothetical protein
MSTQRYVSQELTHFVGRGLKDSCQTNAECQESQYRLLIKILRQGELGKIHTGPGWITIMQSKGVGTPLSSNAKIETLKVCFCDIPVEDLNLHIRKYSQFGLAFTKAYLVTRGVTPVFYISQESLVTNGHVSSNPDSRVTTLKEAFDTYGTDWEQFLGRAWANREVTGVGWFHDLIPLEQKLHWLLFAQLKFFDATKDEVDEANFYMEREWRVIGIVPFTLEDVSRIILPSSFAKRFREDVSAYWGQVTFSD